MRPRSGPPGPAAWVWAAAGTTAAAGLLHVFAAFDHLHAGELVVAFFLVTALGQLAAAAGLTVAAMTGDRPDTRLLIGLLAATVALIGLYLVAHTTDLFAGVTGGGGHAAGGHEAGTTGPVALGNAPPRNSEQPGLLGTATVTVELISVLALTAMLPAHPRRLAGDVLLGLGAAAWLLWLANVLG